MLRLQRTHNVDATVMTVLARFVDRMHAKGGHVLLRGVKSELHDRLQTFRLIKRIGEENAFLYQTGIFTSAKEAVRIARAIVGASIGWRLHRRRRLLRGAPIAATRDGSVRVNIPVTKSRRHGGMYASGRTKRVGRGRLPACRRAARPEEPTSGFARAAGKMPAPPDRDARSTGSGHMRLPGPSFVSSRLRALRNDRAGKMPACESSLRIPAASAPA